MVESPIREPLILGHKTYRKITDDLVRPILGPASWKWYVTTAFTALVMFAGFAAIAYTIWVGIGTWGLNKTVGWAFDITNFVSGSVSGMRGRSSLLSCYFSGSGGAWPSTVPPKL